MRIERLWVAKFDKDHERDRYYLHSSGGDTNREHRHSDGNVCYGLDGIEQHSHHDYIATSSKTARCVQTATRVFTSTIRNKGRKAK